MNQNVKKIGLALGGGGALGAAHIGILEEIERKNIEIDIVSGTSIGAIVGALFLDGGTRKINMFYEEVLKRKIFSTKNLIQSHNTEKVFYQIRQTLEDVLFAKKFSELKKKFLCCATDLETGRLTIFKSGSLVDAIMASSSYPGIFPAQKINGKFYIDGGVTANLPSDILLEEKLDFLIGSSLSHLTDLKISEGKSIASKIKIAQRSIEIMEVKLSQEQIKKCDFCFQPPIEKYSWYNFTKITEIRNIGRKYAKNKINQLIKEIKKL